MRLTRLIRPREALVLAFATLMLSGAIVNATSPTGDVGGYRFDLRDDPGTAVLCLYPGGENPLGLDNLRVRGPRVQWLDSHPLPSGSVGWRVIVQTAPNKNGPWTIESRSPIRYLLAVKDAYRTFKDRTVSWKDRSGTAFVRVVSRLIWFEEDGGVRGWVRHGYTSYGLAERNGSQPGFGDQSATRSGSCPNLWNS